MSRFLETSQSKACSFHAISFDNALERCPDCGAENLDYRDPTLSRLFFAPAILVVGVTLWAAWRAFAPLTR